MESNLINLAQISRSRKFKFTKFKRTRHFKRIGFSRSCLFFDIFRDRHHRARGKFRR